MFLCYESAGFLSWNLFFCVFEICRAAFYRNTPQAELAFIRKGKKKVEGAESKAKLYSLQPAI